jgi:regulation of enolase protein 1 (concanavalin A-like superfamily)
MFGLKYIDKLSYLGEIKINQRNDFLKEIKLKYNYDKIVEDNDLIIMKKSWKWFKLGEELIILFDKEKVLANLTTLGKYDIKVTFFFYKDQIKLSKLKNYC